MIEDCGQPDRSRRARRDMIAEQIEARGIHDPRVLSAIEAVPRERFLPAQFAGAAYEDRALPIEENQTISQPYIVAVMTNSLDVEPDSKVLEVGTGSGYQAAILSKLTGRLFTVERLASLSRAAADRLVHLGITHVEFRVGDGSQGWPEQAPFDRIIVTAAAPSIPQPLLDQLMVGGRMIIPVGDAAQQSLVSVLKYADRTLERPIIPCRFVKLIGRKAWP